MKIKRKKQFWRHSWRLLLGDLMILVSLIVILNVPCGLIRVNGDGLSPDLKDGDLVVISKYDGVFMTNDVVLVSLEKCDLARVVASDDMVEVRDGKLFVNQEEVGQVNEQAKKEIVNWRVDGGFLVDCGEDELRAVLQTQIKGKEILNIRVRNF